MQPRLLLFFDSIRLAVPLLGDLGMSLEGCSLVSWDFQRFPGSKSYASGIRIHHNDIHAGEHWTSGSIKPSSMSCFNLTSGGPACNPNEEPDCSGKGISCRLQKGPCVGSIMKAIGRLRSDLQCYCWMDICKSTAWLLAQTTGSMIRI